MALFLGLILLYINILECLFEIHIKFDTLKHYLYMILLIVIFDSLRRIHEQTYIEMDNLLIEYMQMV